MRADAGSAYEKVERRAGDWAVAAAGAALWLDGRHDRRRRHRAEPPSARDVTRRERRGVAASGRRRPTRLFAEAAALAAEDCSPTADQRGPSTTSATWRGELTLRALRRAAARALREEA